VGAQLAGHRPLDQPLGQLAEQAVAPDDLGLGAPAGQQLVDELIAQLAADLLGQLPGGGAPDTLLGQGLLDDLRRAERPPRL